MALFFPSAHSQSRVSSARIRCCAHRSHGRRAAGESQTRGRCGILTPYRIEINKTKATRRLISNRIRIVVFLPFAGKSHEESRAKGTGFVFRFVFDPSSFFFFSRSRPVLLPLLHGLDNFRVNTEPCPMVMVVSKVILPSGSIEAFCVFPSNKATTTCAFVARCIVFSWAEPNRTSKETVPDERCGSPLVCRNSPNPWWKVQKHEKVSVVLDFVVAAFAIFGRKAIAALVES
mmetsp:Transcript_2065/g.4461  ORF Transcript_2065/g.4461 Transcript_2065/m.4461 type:complete len:232 (+) Transcript_2065:581-1276(+)